MKHTPGPWRIINQNYKDHEGHEIGTSNKTVAFTDIEDTTDPNEQGHANARLIAAAPDMLEALQYVVKWHREHDSGEGELFGLDYVTTCINAIRRATAAD